MNAADRTVVFVGPSLDSSTAGNYLRARFMPPIRRGDLPRAVADNAKSIGIIDGEFGQSLAVSVMEICAALKQGVSIWGAASMGALRAAECQSAGMIGVGWIFQKYADGLLKADDEVALLFDPRNSKATTIPLVNIRWSLETAIQSGVLSPAAEAGLLKLARGVRYTIRTYSTLLDVGFNSPLVNEMRTLVEFMQTNPLICDRKRLDAILLLEAMRANASPSTAKKIHDG